MINVWRRRLATWLPLLGVLLLLPGYSLNGLLTMLAQGALLSWTASRIRQQKAALGCTTAATWVFLAAAVLIVPLSFGVWAFKGLLL